MILQDNEKEYIRLNQDLLKNNRLSEFIRKAPFNVGNIIYALLETGFPIWNYLRDVEPSMFAGCEAKHLEIPEGIEKIGSYAFQGCENLETVIIPDTVRKIGAQAFSECPKLRVLEIPASVIDIGANCFYEDDNIKLVTPKRTVRNRLRLPSNEIDWYREHLKAMQTNADGGEI